MKRTELTLSGLCIIETETHNDARGFFMETYHREKFASLGITKAFVQDNHSRSVQGVVRGLKFQFDEPADKLIRVLQGSIFAVGVDMRPSSRTFGKWAAVELSSDNRKTMYLPFGFAFGFCALSETADVLYKLSAVHNEHGSGTIRWNDPDIGISWPSIARLVSPGDAQAPSFKKWIASGGSTAIERASQ